MPSRASCVRSCNGNFCSTQKAEINVILLQFSCHMADFEKDITGLVSVRFEVDVLQKYSRWPCLVNQDTLVHGEETEKSK